MLQDRPVEFLRGSYKITTNRDALDLDAALALLRATRWGKQMRRELLERAAANSICFAMLDGERLVGFARAVTDLATYAYLTE